MRDYFNKSLKTEMLDSKNVCMLKRIYLNILSYFIIEKESILLFDMFLIYNLKI